MTTADNSDSVAPTDDVALCGDPTCQSPSCRQSAIDAWLARQEQEARDIVRAALGLAEEDGQPRDLLTGNA